MDEVYRDAAVVVSRAGGMTAELTAVGVPSVLVPLPGAPGDHQTANARRSPRGPRLVARRRARRRPGARARRPARRSEAPRRAMAAAGPLPPAAPTRPPGSPTSWNTPPVADGGEPALDLSQPRTVHVVGAGGAGMSAIATVLAQLGHRVTGSDLRESAPLRRLAGHGHPGLGRARPGAAPRRPRRGRGVERHPGRRRRGERRARARHPRAPARRALRALVATRPTVAVRGQPRQDDDRVDARPDLAAVGSIRAS